MESNRRRSGPERRIGFVKETTGRPGKVAIGAVSCRGLGFWRTVFTPSIVDAEAVSTKSLEASSLKLNDSGISPQNRPKASESVKRTPNRLRNFMSHELPLPTGPGRN